ncbi:hypothetical protein Dimus_028851 [Dionaea muscipula]
MERLSQARSCSTTKEGVLSLRRASEGEGVPSPIVITSESHGVKRLSRSCVVEWKSGNCSGFQAPSLLADLAVMATVALLDRSRCLLVFDSDEDFKKVMLLDGSWWACKGIKMAPWAESLILKPLREFGSVKIRDLDDGRIKLLTDTVAPLVVEFKLNELQKDARPSRSGFSLEDHESLGLTPEAAIGAPETTNKCLGRMEVPTADDSDKADNSPWRSDDDENEDGRVAVVEQRHDVDGSSEEWPGALCIPSGPDSCGNGPVHGCGGCKGIGSWAR